MLRWSSLLVVLARMGCGGRDDSPDAARHVSSDAADGTDAEPGGVVDAPRDATVDARVDAGMDAGADVRCSGRPPQNPDPRDPCCDLGAHVDCFWSAPWCVEGVVRVPIHRPIDTCTYAQAQALYHAGICQSLAGRFDCDAQGCRTRPIPRAQACLDGDRLGRHANLLCASMDHRDGTPCGDDGQCWNAEMRPDAWLRCDRDAGRCAWGSRDGDASVAPATCATDNDCPVGQVCALDSACVGRCAALVDGGLIFAVPRSDAGASGSGGAIPTVEAGFGTWDAVVLSELDVR